MKWKILGILQVCFGATFGIIVSIFIGAVSVVAFTGGMLFVMGIANIILPRD